MNHKLKIWLQAIRPFAFSASVIPLLLGAALAFMNHLPVLWPVLPLVIVCGMLFHAGTNVVSEYFDFKKGVDKEHTFGSSRVLIDELAEPKTILILGLSLFIVGSLLGMFLVYVRGIPMLVLGMVGLLGGFFYTGTPFGYKYYGLGDIMVFLLMGPLMVVGSFYALTGLFFPEVVYISLPIGFLVAAILNSNNLRDIRHDRDAGIRTLENTIGYRASQWMYIGLISCAYIGTALLIVTRMIPWWSLIVCMSVPVAIKNIRMVMTTPFDDPAPLAVIDMFSARLHLFFGFLFIVALTIGGCVR